MKVYSAKKKKNKVKLLLFILPFLCLVLIIFSYLHFIAGPIILKSTYAQVDSYATTQISDAIKYTLDTSGLNYDDFVTINYNQEGNVSSIIANSINLNAFARNVSTISQIYLDKIVDQGIDIPIGTFTGLNFLAGRGTKINFKLVPIGSILTNFRSDFKSVGINQTIHTLKVIINTTMTVIMPLSSERIDFETEFLVCENLIVGQVPSVFLSGDLIK